MTTTLIPGSNTGLGLEAARRLLASGHDVWLTARDPDRVEFGIVAPARCSSKSALAMLTTRYAKALTSLRIHVVDPGCTATDLNGLTGMQTVDEGTDAIVALASIGPDGPTGTSTDRDGTVSPELATTPCRHRPPVRPAPARPPRRGRGAP